MSNDNSSRLEVRISIRKKTEEEVVNYYKDCPFYYYYHCLKINKKTNEAQVVFNKILGANKEERI